MITLSAIAAAIALAAYAWLVHAMHKPRPPMSQDERRLHDEQLRHG